MCDKNISQYTQNHSWQFVLPGSFIMAVTFHGLEQDATWQTSMVMEIVGAPEEKGEVTKAEITGKWVRGWTPTAGKLRDEGGGGEAIAKLLRQEAGEGAEGQKRKSMSDWSRS